MKEARVPWLPGVVLMVGMALLAVGMARLEERWLGQPLIEALVLALLLGALLRNALPSPAPFLAGAGLCAKQVLEVGVALLGASVDARQLVRSGGSVMALVVLGVGVGLLVGYLWGRALRLQKRLAILVAVGNAICGNSAIAAVAPVIHAEKQEVATSIALTAVLGVALVLVLPFLRGPLHLSHHQYGVVCGMSVYAVPQVLAAAFPVSRLSGEVATMVKLARIMLLGPVVAGFALAYRGRGPASARQGRRPALLPWFVGVFFVLALARGVGLLPAPLVEASRALSRALTIVAMAGLGFGVELSAVRRVGPRVGAAVVLSLLSLLALTLVLLRVLSI